MDSYPFKGMKECIGILWDQDMSPKEYKLFIEFQQESRQKHKNAYYLQKLCELGLITETQQNEMLQNCDILEFRIESIELDLVEDDLKLQKLKFFHYWFYHYVNNANFRFYKKILKGQTYPFSPLLFGTVLSFLKKAASKQRSHLGKDFIEHVFGIKPDRLYGAQDLKMGTYIVPMANVSSANGQEKLEVNWKLIHDTIDFVQSDLINLCLSDNTEKWKVNERYGLIE